MDLRHQNIDKRFSGIYLYCGHKPDTRDQVPSRRLLDETMPANLPVVESCRSSNKGFSLAEEYVAFLLECVLCESTDTKYLKRENARRTLTYNSSQRERIESNRRDFEDSTTNRMPEEERGRNIILKIGRGYAAFELTLPQLERPARLYAMPPVLMSKPKRDMFERTGSGEIRGWPEIGSRAFLRACGAPPYENQSGPWIVVQDGIYRHSGAHDVVGVPCCRR